MVLTLSLTAHRIGASAPIPPPLGRCASRTRGRCRARDAGRRTARAGGCALDQLLPRARRLDIDVDALRRRGDQPRPGPRRVAPREHGPRDRPRPRVRLPGAGPRDERTARTRRRSRRAPRFARAADAVRLVARLRRRHAAPAAGRRRCSPATRATSGSRSWS